MVRLRGEFGSFEGRVMSWGPDSLVGFTAGSDWDGETPARPVAWSHVRRVDEREDGAMSGAIGGGLIGGLLFAVIGMMGESVAVAASWGTMEPSTERVLTATAIGVAVGALVGSAIGSSSKHWTPVYARP